MSKCVQFIVICMKMGYKIKILLIFICVSFVLNFYTTVPTNAFTSDSYSQQVGDELIWEIKLADMPFIPYLDTTGNRLKFIINTTEKVLIYSTLYDCVWAIAYYNTAANRTWDLLDPNEILIGVYNNTIGIILSIDLILIIPHNESAINAALYLISIGDGYDYTWTPGTNGYDGTGELQKGIETVPGSMKIIMKFNSNGVLQDQKFYSANGTTWELVYHMVLLGSGIPGFLTNSTIFILSIFMAIYALKKKRKSEIFM
ncbi:MAG: hypothetical protein ACFFD2_15025 [Promethearchaeota archaeon]